MRNMLLRPTARYLIRLRCQTRPSRLHAKSRRQVTSLPNSTNPSITRLRSLSSTPSSITTINIRRNTTKISSSLRNPVRHTPSMLFQVTLLFFHPAASVLSLLIAFNSLFLLSFLLNSVWIFSAELFRFVSAQFAHFTVHGMVSYAFYFSHRPGKHV
jgi:hypothetical protein